MPITFPWDTVEIVVNFPLSNEEIQWTFSHDILRVFYKGVQAWVSQSPEVNQITDIKEIQELWDDYLAKLPTALKNQAMPLTSLVIYAPRTTDLKFADIMKAALLISIPDRLMQKAKINLDRQREDQKLGEMKFSADRSSNTVTLTANLEEENKKNFENFVRDNELKSKTSKFENFLCYVEPTTIIDKYTVARCAMQFIDTFRNDILEILNDTEVKAALIKSEISPVTIIKALSDRYAYYLECYMLERIKGNDLLTAKFNQLISDVLGKLSGDGVKDVNFNFTASSAANSNMETLVQEYVDYFKAGIRLQVAPAISEQDKQRQAFVYKNSVAIRDANSGEQVRLRENFSCYDLRLSIQSYIPSDIALNLQSVVDQAQDSDVSDTQILEALFANNLPFLRQLNKEKSGDELYQLALLSLWDAFVNDKSCPAQIKTRQDEIKKQITPDNPALLEVLQNDKQEDNRFLQNLNQDAHIVDSVILALAYPKLLASVNFLDEKQAEFQALYAEDPITRLRQAYEWMQTNGESQYILNAYQGNFDEQLLPENRDRVLRIIRSIDLQQSAGSTLFEKLPEKLRKAVTESLLSVITEEYYVDLPPEITQAFYNAASHNDLATLDRWVSFLPKASAPSVSGGTSSYEVELRDGLDNEKPLPVFFTHQRIQQYLVAQLEKFQALNLSGAKEMLTILKSGLPLYFKLKLIAAIGGGEASRMAMFAYSAWHPEIKAFFTGVQQFDRLTEEKEVDSSFENFLRASGKIDNGVKNLEHHMQRYALIPDELYSMPGEGLKESINAQRLSCVKAPLSSASPLQVFEKITEIQKFLGSSRKVVEDAMRSNPHSSQSLSEVAIDPQKSLFTVLFKRWVLFSIEAGESVKVEDLFLMGVAPKEGDISSCYYALRNSLGFNERNDIAPLYELKTMLHGTVEEKIAQLTSKMIAYADDASLIKNFFDKVEKNYPKVEGVSPVTAAQIAEEWRQYVAQLPKRLQARASRILSSVVIEQPQQFSLQLFSYQESMQARFIGAVPAFLAWQRLGCKFRNTSRRSEILGSYTIEEDARSEQATLKASSEYGKSVQKFEGKILEKEIALGSKSVFHVLSSNMFTLLSGDVTELSLHACAKKYLEFLSSFLKDFIQNQEVSQALNAANISWLHELNTTLAHDFTSYILEKLKGTRQYEYIAKYLMQIINETGSGYLSSGNLSLSAEIDAYVKFATDGINLLVAPAINDGESSRLKSMCSVLINLRDGLTETDRAVAIQESFEGDAAEQYKINLPFASPIPDAAFKDFSAGMSDEKFREHFFISNIGYLWNIAHLSDLPEEYAIALSRLHQAFIADERFKKLDAGIQSKLQALEIIPSNVPDNTTVISAFDTIFSGDSETERKPLITIFSDILSQKGKAKEKLVDLILDAQMNELAFSRQFPELLTRANVLAKNETQQPPGELVNEVTYNTKKNSCKINNPILLTKILLNSTERNKYARNSITVDIDETPYILGELVGQGAQACVFSVENQPGKVIKVSKCIVSNSLQKIEQEAVITQDLGILANASSYHLEQKEDLRVPEIVDLHFMVLEDLGSDLSKPKKDTSAQAINKSYQRAIKTCLALHNLHSGTASKSNTPYAHLDLKPSNIVEDYKGNVRLIDFADAQENPGDVYWDKPSVEGTPIYLPSKKVLSTCTKAQVDIIGLMRSLYIPKKFHGRDREYEHTEATFGYVFKPLTNSTDRFSEEVRSLLDTTDCVDDKIVDKDRKSRDYPSALDLAVGLSLLKMRCSLEKEPFNNYKTFTPEKKKIINDFALSGAYFPAENIKEYIEDKRSAENIQGVIIEQSIKTAIGISKDTKNMRTIDDDDTISTHLPKTYAASQYVNGRKSFNKYDLLQVIRIFSEPDTQISGRSKKNLPESYKVVQKKLEETAKLVGITDEELRNTLYLDTDPVYAIASASAFKAIQKDGLEKYGLREILRQRLYQAAQNNENDKLTAIATALSVGNVGAAVSDLASASKKVIFFNDQNIVDYLLEQLKTFRRNIYGSGVPLSGKIGSADAIETILNGSLPLSQKLQLLSDIARGKLSNEKDISRRSLKLRKFYQGLACFDGVSADNMTTAFTNFLKETGKIDSSVNNIEDHIQRYQLIKDGLTAIPKESFNGKDHYPETNQMGVAQTRLEVLRDVTFKPSAELFVELRSIDRFLENHSAAVQNAILHPAKASAIEAVESFSDYFKRWMQYSIETGEQIRANDLALIGAAVVTEDVEKCFISVWKHLPELFAGQEDQEQQQINLLENLFHVITAKANFLQDLLTSEVHVIVKAMLRFWSPQLDDFVPIDVKIWLGDKLAHLLAAAEIRGDAELLILSDIINKVVLDGESDKVLLNLRSDMSDDQEHVVAEDLEVQATDSLPKEKILHGILKRPEESSKDRGKAKLKFKISDEEIIPLERVSDSQLEKINSYDSLNYKQRLIMDLIDNRRLSKFFNDQDILKYLVEKLGALSAGGSIENILASQLPLHAKFKLIGAIAKVKCDSRSFKDSPDNEKELYLELQAFADVNFKNSVYPAFTKFLKSQKTIDDDVSSVEVHVQRYVLIRQSLMSIPEAKLKAAGIQGPYAFRKKNIFETTLTVFEEIDQFKNFLDKNKESLVIARTANNEGDNTRFTKFFMRWVKFSINTNQPLQLEDLMLIGVPPTLDEVVKCRDTILAIEGLKKNRQNEFITQLYGCYEATIKQAPTFQGQFERWVDFSVTTGDVFEPEITAPPATEQELRDCYAYANQKLTLPKVPVDFVFLTMEGAASSTDSEQSAQEPSKKEQQGSVFASVLQCACVENFIGGEVIWRDISQPKTQQEAGPRDMVVHQDQKGDVASSDSTLGLPELCNQYSSASDKKAIESAVDKQCTQRDLIYLRNALESFRGLTRGSSKFFKHEYLPTGMQTVVDMIDNSTALNPSTTACEVLIKLQKVAASSSERWTFGGRNEKTAQAYEAINKFFEKRSDGVSIDQDINSLVDAITGHPFDPNSGSDSTLKGIYEPDDSTALVI